MQHEISVFLPQDKSTTIGVSWFLELAG